MSSIALLTLSAASLSAAAMTTADRIGVTASTSAATRTIAVGPTTRWVNVTQGETVKFVSNGQEFAWHFNGTMSPMNLEEIAPRGALQSPHVPVYVGPDAMQSGSYAP